MVDKITPEGLPALGVIETKTTSFGGHPPEFWAERLTEKLVGTSENLEPHIEAQAKAYEEEIEKVCLIYIRNAIKSYKASLIQELTKAGDEDLANIIKRI
jgi:hypothetical protein|tara:strand:+ start:908 stop:1207 length:300 start_codon:yes stop_codon:yes gene_type:complete